MSPVALLLLLLPGHCAAIDLDLTSSDGWQRERRGTVEFGRAGVALDGAMLLSKGEPLTDFELRARARIGDGVKDGGIWLRFRYRGEHEHYALGLRGWPSDDLYLYRFGPGGGDRLLALEPLDSPVAAGKWYDLRIQCIGPGIDVFVGNEREPRLSVTDPDPIANGTVGVGGGYRPTEFASLDVEPITDATSAAAERDALRAAAADRRTREEEASRRRQRARGRARYRPVRLPPPGADRQEVLLDGPWLFLPDQDRVPGKDPRDHRTADGQWHAMDVPAFWTPVRWWMYGSGSGMSDRWERMERERTNALSFDPDTTHAGWYRHWIEVPAPYSGRRLALHFDAVAMACEVWLNDRYVGGHIGMFAPFELELPPDALRFGGRNLLTVLVVDGAYQANPGLSELLGPEITARLADQTLDGLPHGLYGRSAGIWQPVRLVATAPVHLGEVYVQTAVDGLVVQADVMGDRDQALQARAVVTDPTTDTEFVHLNSEVEPSKEQVTLETHDLAPRLWCPDQPNLYDLRLELVDQPGAVLDSRETRIGFRSFEVQGNRLCLSGRPYWLRGAGQAPSGTCPNSEEVARSFVGKMHEGNEVFTRADGGSFAEPWLTACDEFGVGVSLMGVWPEVMIDDSAPPSQALLDVWEAEWTGVMRRVRNHPSLLMWTLNNESYWYRATDPELAKRKWEIATHMVQATRRTDPTRPVVCDSGYVRDADTYASVVAPNGFDDGDIDDAHLYYGWYWPSPWYLLPQRSASAAGPTTTPLETPFARERPAVSQECTAGYPNNDTGHPIRRYVGEHHVAQAWVGDYAYEDRDPAVFLARHAWMSKALGEIARRHRQGLDGILHFSNSTWFRFPYLPSETEPFPVCSAMKAALSPVLVSADLRRLHFYEGDTLEFDVHVVNDSPDGLDLPPTRVDAALVAPGPEVIAQAAAQIAPVPYYGSRVVRLSLATAERPDAGERTVYRLTLGLRAGETQIATNEYELVGAGKEWAGYEAATRATRESLTAGEGGTLIANGSDGIDALRDRPELQEFVEGGGRILILNAGEHAARLLPGVVLRATTWRPGIVSVEDETSPILDGLQPWDLCWFNVSSGLPVAATGGLVINRTPDVNVLATAIRPHGYLDEPEDVGLYEAVVLFEAKVGQGRVIVSEMDAAAAATDPIAARVVSNLLRYLGQT